MRPLVAVLVAAVAASAAAAPALAQDPSPRGEVRVNRPAPPVGTGHSSDDWDPVVAINNDYRSALGSLAGGEPGTALESILALERESEAGQQTTLGRATTKVEMMVAEEIARRDPRALLPVALLHYHLLRSNRARGNQAAAVHHAQMVSAILGTFAQRLDSSDARRNAGILLDALATELIALRARLDAEQILQRSLDLNPDNPTALLVLASERERDGGYEEAVKYLERLVAIEPASVEGRLRLAVNLRRTGRARDATDLLTALTRLPEPGPEVRWAVEVAYQELARLRLDREDPQGAVALLEKAVERFPEAEGLRLELAFALERTGDPGAARAAVAQLADLPATGGESPRRRYSSGVDPTPLLEALAGVEDRAATFRPALAQVLADLAEETGG